MVHKVLRYMLIGILSACPPKNPICRKVSAREPSALFGDIHFVGCQVFDFQRKWHRHGRIYMLTCWHVQSTRKYIDPWSLTHEPKIAVLQWKAPQKRICKLWPSAFPCGKPRGMMTGGTKWSLISHFGTQGAFWLNLQTHIYFGSFLLSHGWNHANMQLSD